MFIASGALGFIIGGFLGFLATFIAAPTDPQMREKAFKNAVETFIDEATLELGQIDASLTEERTNDAFKRFSSDVEKMPDARHEKHCNFALRTMKLLCGSLELIAANIKNIRSQDSLHGTTTSRDDIRKAISPEIENIKTHLQELKKLKKSQSVY